MKNQIFNFWSEMKMSDLEQDEIIHPKDKEIFQRITHSYALKSLPLNFRGKLKTAKIVLLYLNPGYDKANDERELKEFKEEYFKTIKGESPLKSKLINQGSYKWWKGRSNFLNLPEEWLIDNLAILNIGAYHSKSFKDKGTLASLPSSRIAINWAQEVLFKEAEEGKRLVICMRSSKFWGLKEGYQKGLLFSPKTTRGGHILNGEVKDRIVKVAKKIHIRIS